ncbi:hypothetical protein SpCBS45565_g07105 [Spizellomyces sp. 'palustris']|nr:hypothetical protein SpCBS45565_g07105 [Spizellomyces sp. 'palustris']
MSLLCFADLKVAPSQRDMFTDNCLQLRKDSLTVEVIFGKARAMSHSPVHVPVGPDAVDMPPSTSDHQPLLPRAAERAREVTRSNWDDFKEFINRGKVVDLAVGIVIGAGFSSIVSSLVDDLLSPVLSLIVGNQLENAFVVLKPPDMDSEACKQHEAFCVDPKTPQQAHAVGAITFNYGHFIQRIINFFLIAFILFFLIKAYAQLLHKGSKFLKRYRDCPWCLEEIPEKARKCKYCGSEVAPLNRGVEVAVDRSPPGVAQ